MDFRHLELLRELADRGTITAVAAATYRSASAVSQQLRSAERSFGTALVEPDGRGLRLTAAGRLLASGAADIASALARLQRGLDELTGEPAGTVSIVGLPSAMEFLVPHVFARLEGTRIELRLDDADVAEADFASLVADYDLVVGHTLGTQPAGTEGVPHHVVATEPLDVALPVDHRLADRTALRAADLAGERWIGVPLGYPFDTVRISIENQAGEPLHVVQRVRDNRLVEALVAAGQGCALLPRFTTRPRPGVVLVPLSDVRSARRIVALGRPDRLERAAVRVVVEALSTVGAELA